jgi:pimeloyl-ACP methyl ester carboxylesterase
VKTARLNGVDIAYEDAGASEDVLLFVHGHPFDRTMWTPQTDHFSQNGWRVLAPDLRGYGSSGAAHGKTKLEAFSDDLIALLDHLEIEKPIIVGLSMGGQIAMEVARAHGARLRGLVLAATFSQGETQEGRLTRYAVAERLEVEGMHAYADRLLPRMLAPRTIAQDPRLARFVLEMMRRAPAIGAAAALRGRAERIDYGPILASLRLPTLIVGGREDPFTSRDEVEHMRETIRDAVLLRIEEAGHMPNLEAAPVFNAALQRFIEPLKRAS